VGSNAMTTPVGPIIFAAINEKKPILAPPSIKTAPLFKVF
jgi:hypothetical protein